MLFVGSDSQNGKKLLSIHRSCNPFAAPQHGNFREARTQPYFIRDGWRWRADANRLAMMV